MIFRENLMMKLVLVYQSMKVSVCDKTNLCSFTVLFVGGLLSSINCQRYDMNIWLSNMKINWDALLDQQFLLAEPARSLKVKCY